MMDFETVNYFNELGLVADPYPYFEYLRAKGPVVPLPKHNVVAVVGYEEGMKVLRDHETFSSINSATGPLPPLPFKPEGEDITDQIAKCRGEMAFGSMLVTQDPPDHTKSRALLTGLLTPRRLKENEDFIHQAADRKISEFIDDGKFEAVSQFGHPLATLTIADLLGVPEEDHELFCSLLGPLPGQIGGDVPLENNPMMEIGMHFFKYIDERRREPKNDIMTELANARYPGGELPDIVEITGHAATLFGAGQDTTVRLLVAMLKTLGEDHKLQAYLRDNPQLFSNFIEEVLRLDGPTKAHFRLAKRRAKVGDLEVEPGTTIMLMQSAMRRDPRRFESPNEFRLDRKNLQPQMAFGQGIHMCMGAPLARTEAKIALEHIFKHTSLIDIDEEFHGPVGNRHYEYEANYTQRALCAVHLKFKKA
ncbi:cytochrome P450 [Pseudomaricurvus sp. HS19]|uniref:cytochrome P450 n=1 Tax=Pseudomaricurvus sp. HS19 TaxID=2692626 RepID=UPI00136FEA54|nr:cytochrome P450 [Pseudomaricurvus sp. HS19]MYM62815.1 cytochrome P450 [Pseudomaricurvus sp. HS19]